jgi:hypothetical protein
LSFFKPTGQSAARHAVFDAVEPLGEFGQLFNREHEVL